jgi:FkbM family methyltransferase
MFDFQNKKHIAVIGSGALAKSMVAELTRAASDPVSFSFYESDASKTGQMIMDSRVGALTDLPKSRAEMVILGFSAEDAEYAAVKSRLSSEVECPIYSAVEVFESNPNIRGWPILDKAAAVAAQPLYQFVSAHLADKESRNQYEKYYRWICRDSAAKPPVGVIADQYFSESVIKLCHDEVFVDCGAYRGDTLAAFLMSSKNNFSEYYAFEPDFSNFTELVSYANGIAPAFRRRIRLVNAAVARMPGWLSFECSGSQTSRQATQGDYWVRAHSLADFPFRLQPTFVKFDLEGADCATFASSLGCLMTWRPKICIAIYHNPQDFLEIPILAINSLKNYKFHVRSHNKFGLDFVLYCIPDKL